MDFDKTSLIGNTLQEYELLDYPDATQAFYIQCSVCTDHFNEYPSDFKLCSDLADGIRLEYESRFGAFTRESTRAGSMTDATTVETTGVNTPMVLDEYEHKQLDGTPLRKRKIEITLSTSAKRGRIDV